MPPYSLRRLMWGGPVSTAAAILANLAYYGVTHALGEYYLLPMEGGGSSLIRMPVFMPVLLTLVAGGLATLLFGLLIRFARRPGTVFLSLGCAALLLSLGGPFNLPAVTLQTKFLLGGMHILAAMLISGGILLMSHKGANNH
jgi:hypothetical protein